MKAGMNKVVLLLLMVMSIVCISNIYGTPSKGEHALDIIFPFQWCRNIDNVNFPEPSGIVFHPHRQTLFAVGDGGDLCEIKKDGTLIKQKHLRNADFEGITCDPATGLLYVAVEGEEKIIEIAPDDFDIKREFVINRTFQGATVLKEGGQGIEGLTFLPDSKHPQGGTFYVANQSFTLDDKQDLSAVFEVEAPLKDSSERVNAAKIIRCLSIGVIDLAALHYDKTSDHLFVVSDATNAIFEITRQGEILSGYAFPGDNQEGIAVDDESNLYIAQDTGGIIKGKWNRKKQGE